MQRVAATLLLCLALWTAPAVGLELSAEEQAWLAAHPELRLGVDGAWPPFEFRDEQGRYQGLAADYINVVRDRLAVKVTPVEPVSWTEVLDQVKHGKLDLLPGIMSTPERQNYLSFTRPYLDFPIVILALAMIATALGYAPVAVAFFAAALGMAIFGAIPFTDAMIVRYVDDSKATNTHAASTSLRAYDPVAMTIWNSPHPYSSSTRPWNSINRQRPCLPRRTCRALMGASIITALICMARACRVFSAATTRPGITASRFVENRGPMTSPTDLGRCWTTSR